VFDAIYNDTWRSFLLREETGVPGENNIPTQMTDKLLYQMTDKLLYHNVRFVCLWCLMSRSTIFQLYRRRSVLLVEETGVPGENHWPSASHWQNFITKCFIEYTSQWGGFELITLVVVDTDCTGSYKSNYHASTTTTTTSL